MRTKEEILNQHYPDFDVKSGWMFDGPVEKVFEAMDEYAKEFSMAFGEYLRGHDWYDNLKTQDMPTFYERFLNYLKAEAIRQSTNQIKE